jgi:type I restriction enzyme S subunit
VVGFVPNTNVTREYLYYVFRAMKPELLRKAPVNTEGNLNVDRIGSRRIALPPVIEQHAIVLQIEEQTLGLNAMTDRIENEIALLREYRTRLIADVVTGKLDVCEAAA